MIDQENCQWKVVLSRQRDKKRAIAEVFFSNGSRVK